PGALVHGVADRPVFVRIAAVPNPTPTVVHLARADKRGNPLGRNRSHARVGIGDGKMDASGKVLLLNQGEKPRQGGPSRHGYQRGAVRIVAVDAIGWQSVVRVEVVVQSQTDLFEVV